MSQIKKALHKLKHKLVHFTGVWFYDVKKLPVGTYLHYFLKYRTKIDFSIVFDVGANDGSTAIHFKEFFPDATIYCFEPVSTTFSRLSSNVNKYADIIGYKLAFGDKEEFLNVSILPEHQSVANTLTKISDKSQQDETVERIEVQTLDLFLSKHPEINHIDLLKIDTEGYDLRVLMGASKAIEEGKIKAIYTEVGFSINNKLHVHLSDMISFCESHQFVFMGLFSVDIRHSPWDRHFGNALFIHRSQIQNVKI
jgi:FkbM family methyltransferase